eukprot:scaffold24451_cov62-Phaeocystis_antarctica.AAC.5
MSSRSWPYGPAIAATAADILDKAIVTPALPFFLSNSSSDGIGVPEAADGSDDEDDRLLGLNTLSLSEDDRSDDEDSGSDEEEEGRTSARVLQARKRHLQAETRVDVRSYHAKHRALTVPHDPYAVDVQTVQPRAFGACSRTGGERRAPQGAEGGGLGRAVCGAGYKRQQDRGKLGTWEACKRARQEAVSVRCPPPAIMPPSVPEHSPLGPSGSAAGG